MIKKIVQYHLIPLAIAIGILSLVYALLPNENSSIKTIQLTNETGVKNGLFPDFSAGVSTELAFMSSLKNPNQITLFGSSEFSGNSNYFPYKFLTDSLNINCLAFGKAYHQQLSILCELMAGREFLKGSKITIVISPGWFESDGTNPEAFLEFVTPNFLRKIIHDSLIGWEYKNHIGKFINENSHLFNGLSKEQLFLKDLYLMNDGNLFNKTLAQLNQFVRLKHRNRYYIKNVVYEPTLPENLPLKKWRFNTDSILKAEQLKFLASVQNDLYVNQEYFDTYLIESDGKQREGKVAEKDYLTSNELKDFEILLKFLKENDADASFILLPINPYFYENLSIQKPLIDHLSSEITKANFPFLNLYSFDKENYKKGMLRDVMHVGEYGWIIINEFMTKTYFENYEF
jgi:D-alanine transfer protein